MQYLVPSGYPENPSNGFQTDLTDLTSNELNNSCILGGIRGTFSDLFGTKSRSIAVYSTSDIDLYEAEAKIDVIMTKIMNKNKGVLL